MVRKRRTTKKKTLRGTELAVGQLTTNFWEYEVGRSSTAVREGIDNAPDDQVLRAAKTLAENVLQPVRDHFGIPFAPGSWYRSEELEKVVARKGFWRWLDKYNRSRDADSWKDYFNRKQHPKGFAADIEIPGVDNSDLFFWIKENCEYDQLIREGYRSGDPKSGWIHVSYKTTGNRKEAFDIANP